MNALLFLPAYVLLLLNSRWQINRLNSVQKTHQAKATGDLNLNYNGNNIQFEYKLYFRYYHIDIQFLGYDNDIVVI